MSSLTRSLIRMNALHQRRHFAKKCGSGSGSGAKTGGDEGSVKKYSKRMIKFKKLQEKFQRDDGNPVFLKNGAKDRLLYLSTLGLCVVGLILDFQYYGSYIFK